MGPSLKGLRSTALASYPSPVVKALLAAVSGMHFCPGRPAKDCHLQRLARLCFLHLLDADCFCHYLPAFKPRREGTQRSACQIFQHQRPRFHSARSIPERRRWEGRGGGRNKRCSICLARRTQWVVCVCVFNETGEAGHKISPGFTQRAPMERADARL